MASRTVTPTEFWNLTVGELYWLREAAEDSQQHGKNMSGYEVREIYEETYGEIED